MTMEWQPIETAPRDRWKKIDIWVVHRPSGKGRRVADAKWAPRDGKDAWETLNGDSFEWVTGVHHDDELGRRWFDPTRQDEHSTVATHWRPLPDPPASP